MEVTVDFLGIGAQKSATTWLYRNLRKHGEIWLPPRKELHYFDRSRQYPSPSILASKYLIVRLIRVDIYRRRYISYFFGNLIKAIREKDKEKSRWILRYYCGTYDDEWYVSLFERGKGKIKGEITPSYSILDLKDVRHIRTLFPHLKVILLLRNPIDRAWSHVRFHWMRGKFTDIRNIRKIKRFIDSPDQSLRSDYVRTIGNWSACFPIDRIFIGFFDDVLLNPQKMLKDVFQFLGVDPETVSSADILTKPPNASKKMEMPAEIESYLAEKYCPELEKLSRLVGGRSIAWLEEARKILDKNRSSGNFP